MDTIARNQGQAEEWQPFYKTVMGAIRSASAGTAGEMMRLLFLIEETRIERDHDEIAAAIEERFGCGSQMHLGLRKAIHAAKESLLAQKQAILNNECSGKVAPPGRQEDYDPDSLPPSPSVIVCFDPDGEDEDPEDEDEPGGCGC